MRRSRLGRRGAPRGVRRRAGGAARRTCRVRGLGQTLMTRLALDPARAAEEMAEFSRRMAQAASGLATLEVASEGCSPRVEAFRLDRTVLWRYRPAAQSAGLAPLVICY